MAMTPFCRNKNKFIIILPTLHQGREVNTHTPRPQTVEFVNKSEGGVKTLNEPCNTHSCSKKINRRPFCIFSPLMNMAEVHSIVIFNSVMVAKWEEANFKKTAVSP